MRSENLTKQDFVEKNFTELRNMVSNMINLTISIKSLEPIGRLFLKASWSLKMLHSGELLSKTFSEFVGFASRTKQKLNPANLEFYVNQIHEL